MIKKTLEKIQNYLDKNINYHGRGDLWCSHYNTNQNTKMRRAIKYYFKKI